MSEKDVDDDYKYARSTYYRSIEQGQEAVEMMFELAKDTDHPRAYEVLANLIKQNSDVAEKLMKLQKEKKEVNKEDTPKLDAPVTNNNLFVGSTADLKKLIDERSGKIIESE